MMNSYDCPAAHLCTSGARRYNLTRIIMTFLTAFIYAAIYWKQGDVGACARFMPE
jgi:hypothetical protein